MADILIKGLSLPKTNDEAFMVIIKPNKVVDVKEDKHGYYLQKEFNAYTWGKEEPMEVTDIHVDEYYCPACGAENMADYGKVRDRYCPNCGQKIYQKDGETWL